MECSLSPAPTAMEVAPAATLPVTPGGLAAAFAAVPDPRRQASVDYTLPAILTLAVAAILSAHQSVLAIAEWGRARSGTCWPGWASLRAAPPCSGYCAHPASRQPPRCTVGPTNRSGSVQ